ncbi:MAG: ASKHA domain-containing protein [Candidatus Omnitrophica bacterium]|nr:ASKHA domain-containing protein [Candidatus Omnitrophota bacterium]MDD5352572.1 ASKHA domain-containing protein [Candidatus Omnitrophota bacterium]MDD5550170.1 ASKHA domain-containing protein [Candidatus Omnitrophota bacterium]
MEKFKVTFYPDNKVAEVDKGSTILSSAISAGIYLNSSCGGDGVCGRCKVIVKKGSVYAQPSGRISQEERKKGYVLACLATIESDLEVEIPAESRLGLDRISVYTKTEEIETVKPAESEDIFIHSPLATKLFLELPQPDQADRISDLERLYRGICKIKDIQIMQTGLANIRGLGELLRLSDWKVTVTLGNRNGTTEIVLVEPQDTSLKNYGIAFDIGTTTLSGQLVDLNNKKVLGTRITYNRQATFGADVISRIIYAQKEDGLGVLHHAVIDGMNMIIVDLISEHGINLSDVTCCVCAGNTTMIHLLLKVDPTFIRRDPYVPTANFVPVVRAAEAGLRINPRGLLFCVSGISSYVGGDVTAGVLSSGMYKTEKLTLFIDIGTNGEIVLGNKDWLICAAASAGPAFEGSGVACGMRAVNGAIQRVSINPKDLSLKCDTIGNVPPSGICGSGYIDLLAELLKTGIIDKNGKFNTNKANTRIRDGEQGKEFVVANKKDSDIVITEADIENIKRAKAAIFSAASVLVRHMGLEFSAIEQIFIAGGFGTYLDIEKSITIGLLPDLDRKKFSFIGNSSLAGSREILLSSDALQKSQDIAKKMTYFELSTDATYMDEYVAALFFPHTDSNRFASVKI